MLKCLFKYQYISSENKFIFVSDMFVKDDELSYYNIYDNNFIITLQPGLVGILKSIRCYLGVSQLEFSKKLSIPKRTIEDWERGAKKPTPYLVGLIFSKVFKC